MTTTYRCHRCHVPHDVDLIDGYTGLCPACHGKAPAVATAHRRCEWCGVAISGYSNRRTHSTACRVALHRAGGVGPHTPTEAA
jgi:hypothetical protein